VGLLDHVALHMGLKWRYSEGRIHFYRIVSRTFVVKTMPGNLTQSGGVSVGTMAVNGNSEVNIWSGIEKNLALMMSRYGRFHVDQSMGTVTVHDASINVEAVDRYVDSLNRQLGRQVALHVEVLQVTLSNEHQAGIAQGSQRVGCRDINPRADHVSNHHADQGDHADRAIRWGGLHGRTVPYCDELWPVDSPVVWPVGSPVVWPVDSPAVAAPKAIIRSSRPCESQGVSNRRSVCLP
jgi:hypothetical protein